MSTIIAVVMFVTQPKIADIIDDQPVIEKSHVVDESLEFDEVDQDV